MCAFHLLMTRGHKQHYYLYECLDPADQMPVFLCAIGKFLTGVASIGLDFLLLGRVGFGDTLWKLHGICLFTGEGRLRTIASITTACVIFTSCFLIKHDGLAILQVLSPCT